jgi:Inner membrane protein YgaP-like, transmembrane domain
MSLERAIRLIAGTFIIASVALSYFHSRYWLWFTLFVGLNLFQSALTRWCLMEDILRKLGVGSEAAHPMPVNTARTHS